MTVSILPQGVPTARRTRASVGDVVLLHPADVPTGAEVLGVLVRLPAASAATTATAATTAPFATGSVSGRGAASPRDTGPAVVRPAAREIHAGLVLDEDARTVRSHGEELSLTRLEFDLLVHVSRHPGRVLTRDGLLRAVWDRDPAWSSSRTVDVHVLRLRRALGEQHAGALRTVRGVGYRWVP